MIIMNLKEFRRASQGKTTVLIEYSPDAAELAPKITIYKIGGAEQILDLGRTLKKIDDACGDTARPYAFIKPLTDQQQTALLKSSEADKLKWFDQELNHHNLYYAF